MNFKDKPRHFRGKKIAVIGAGIEGVSSAIYLAKKGGVVTVIDEKELEDATITKLKNANIKVLSGDNYLDTLGGFEIIVRSPGIRLDIEELEEAKREGAEITSQTKLFFDLCPSKIIGVTGTKGKGTTSSLIFEILKEAGKDVYLGGNIGKPPFDFLDKLNEHSIVVLELSSYQLQDLTKSPHIAVALMITHEHLSPDKKDSPHQNYHKSVEEYVDAKRNIFRFQNKEDFAIVNKDYPASNESDIHTEAKVYKVSRSSDVIEGCLVVNGKIVLKIAETMEEIIETEDILLPGEHNFENVCAAVMASYLAGASRKDMVRVLKTFKGLEHRLELVREINGVRYYDDSFSTTPETAIAAIQAFKDPEILILGGASKGSDFKELGEVISNSSNIKAIIGVGIEWKKIKSQIPNHKSQKFIEGLKNMNEIVKKASHIAESGDVVLLSPACSSFDMFKNYKERGDIFKKEVEKLVE